MEPRLITAYGPPESPARVQASARAPLRVGLVQERWHRDPDEHLDALATAIRVAAAEGARLVCLQELTLSPYFAVVADGLDVARQHAEDVPDGPTTRFLAGLAAETGAHVHGSLYERADGDDGLGFNTAVVVAPERRGRRPHAQAPHPGDGRLLRGPLLPSRSGEGRLSRSSSSPTRAGASRPAGTSGSRSSRAPTRSAGADVIVYPTAIGSEPDHPGFDTEPLWERVITANGIANGTFMVAVNRIGIEPPLTFYGSSFVSDPYGRILVQAPRDEPAVLVADLDLDQRRDWLALFPFLAHAPP